MTPPHFFRIEPVASTSRVPYGPAAVSVPRGPVNLPTYHAPAASSRPFSTSSPRPSPRGRSRAHLIHPMARQRLTNLAFLSAGLLSVLTVSLTMSGTFGEGAAPGCPARVRTGVALEEEERRSAAAVASSHAENDGRKRWWETSKAKGRFLEDPTPAVAAAPPRLVRSTRSAPPDAAEVLAAEPPRQSLRPTSTLEQEEAVSKAAARRTDETGGSRSRWRDTAGEQERLV